MKTVKNKIITIDGPAGAGKSTVARKLAKILKVYYLDTGAMYRALTFKAIQRGVNLEDEDELAGLVKTTKIDLEDQDGEVKVLLDGVDVSREIRSIEVTNKTFFIARAARVRETMVQWQRAMGLKRSVVAEGRDIGTVVFPQAAYKFYLDADFQERSKRRIDELKGKGTSVDESRLKEELKDRDTKDLTRRVGPLKKAEDAVVIDSTRMTADEVVAEILKHINFHH
ncbi:MAG TPA: (d)CMP kinase [Candidatus Omnitrophica bacterium]|nr:MAG: cytidylate kinase [Omnitrophica WOR_2 bacterium GWA2_45_18]OGX19982.1 MAG: cytidylate kinase [Omnitrophica WOR_2 bacterium GWC2_45_7]HBR14744.1 (d)CMP kinase [Candidatus Omnitrophota bacterium]